MAKRWDWHWVYDLVRYWEVCLVLHLELYLVLHLELHWAILKGQSLESCWDLH